MRLEPSNDRIVDFIAFFNAHVGTVNSGTIKWGEDIISKRLEENGIIGIL